MVAYIIRLKISLKCTILFVSTFTTYDCQCANRDVNHPTCFDLYPTHNSVNASQWEGGGVCFGYESKQVIHNRRPTHGNTAGDEREVKWTVPYYSTRCYFTKTLATLHVTFNLMKAMGGRRRRGRRRREQDRGLLTEIQVKSGNEGRGGVGGGG